MSDNITQNIDIEVNGTDHAAAQIRKLERELDQLRLKLQNAFSGRGKTSANLIDPKIQAQMEDLGKTGEKISQKWVTDFGRMASIGKLTSETYAKIASQIAKHEDAFEKTGKLTKAQAGSLERLYAKANAFTYVWNRGIDNRMRLEQKAAAMSAELDDRRAGRTVADFNQQLRNINYIGRVQRSSYALESKLQTEKYTGLRKGLELRENSEKVEQRRISDRLKQARAGLDLRLRSADLERSQIKAAETERERAQRAELRRQRDINQERRRDFSAARQGFQRVRNGARTVTGVGAAAAGVAVAGSSSLLDAAVKMDTEKNYGRIFQHMSKEASEKWANEWAIPKGFQLGVTPDQMMGTANEASQAGVPEEMVQPVTEMFVKGAAAVRMAARDFVEAMGPSIAQLKGKGQLTEDKLQKVVNMTIGLANETAATRASMISAVKTGMGTGDIFGMDEAHAGAFMATLIEGGAQGQQASRALGTFGSKIFGLADKESDIFQKGGMRDPKNRRFIQDAQELGYGSWKDLADRLRTDPNNTPMDFLQRIGKIPDKVKAANLIYEVLGSDFARFELNAAKMDESAAHNLAIAQKAMNGEKDYLGDAWGVYTEQAAFDIAKWKVAWFTLRQSLGTAFFPYLHEAVDVIGGWAMRMSSGGFGSVIKNAIDGFVQGLGYDNFRAMLEDVFKDMDAGSFDKVKEFAKGFAAGIKEIWGYVKSAFLSMAGFFGTGDNAEAIGKFAGKLLALSAALVALSPVISVLTMFVGAIVATGRVLKGLFNGAKWLKGKVFGTAATAAGEAGAVAGAGEVAAGAAGTAEVAGAAAIEEGAIATIADALIPAGLAVLGTASMPLVMSILGATLAAGALYVAITNWDAIKDYWDRFKQRSGEQFKNDTKDVTGGLRLQEEIDALRAQGKGITLEDQEKNSLWNFFHWLGTKMGISEAHADELPADKRGARFGPVPKDQTGLIQKNAYLTQGATDRPTRASAPPDSPVGLIQKSAFRMEDTTDRLAKSFEKMGAKLELAALQAGTSPMAGGGGTGGGGGDASPTVPLTGGPSSPDAVLPSAPIAPDLGLSRDGIIRRTPGAGQDASPGEGGVRTGGSRSWRNNNPGNIKYGPRAREMGATGRDNRGFAVFPSYEAGRRAQENLMFNSPAYRGKTIAQAISKWAPPSENDTAGYIRTMTQALGVDANTPLSSLTPDQRSKFLDVQQRREGWIAGRTAPAAPGVAAGAGSQGGGNIIPGAPAGLARELGIENPQGFAGANFMHGQYGGIGQNLTTVTTPGGRRVTVNAAAAESFKGFLGELEASGYHINSLGGYANRAIRGSTSRASQHAYGNAIDINPNQNPMGYGPLHTNLPANISDIAAKYGLAWGGHWKNRKDAMHFEWMGMQPWKNPAIAARLRQQHPLAHAPAPTPNSVTSGVPAAAPGSGGGGGAEGGAGGGGGGDARASGQSAMIHAPITIHGAGKNPQEIAQEVQRHIQNAMNWRTHDVETGLA